MTYQEESKHSAAFADIPPELLSIARSIMRDCRTPGNYSLTFTISPHKSRIQTASLTKLEQIREMNLAGRPK